MKRMAITAILTLGLTACTGTGGADEAPGLARGSIPKAIRTQTYVPGGNAVQPPDSRPADSRPADRQSPGNPPSRPPRGSSSPPPSGAYIGVPVTPLPGVSTDRAVSDLKRDQARSELDRLNNFPNPLTPEPWRQREIMNQQLDLDRQELMRR